MPKEISTKTAAQKKSKTKKIPKLPLPKSNKDLVQEVTKGNELAIIDNLTQDYDWIRPIVQLRGMTLIQNKRVLLNDFFLEVKKGQICGIIGSDNSKNLILKIISLKTAKSAGKILLDGLDVDTYKEQVKSLVVFNPQQKHWFQILNLKQTLQWLAFNYKTKIKAKTILELTKLEQEENLRIKNLNTFQKSLWNIARSLTAKSPILLLEEPLKELDPDQIKILKSVLSSIKLTGKTIVLTAQTREQAEIICDSLVTVEQGRVIKK